MNRRGILKFFGVGAAAVAVPASAMASAAPTPSWEHRELSVKVVLCKHKYAAIFPFDHIFDGTPVTVLPWPIPECIHCGHRPTTIQVRRDYGLA